MNSPSTKMQRTFSRLMNVNDLTPLMTDGQIVLTHFLDLLERLCILSTDGYINAMLLLDDQIEEYNRIKVHDPA